MSVAPGLEAQGTRGFMEGGKCGRRWVLLPDQPRIETQATGIAEAAEQPQQILIPQLPL